MRKSATKKPSMKPSRPIRSIPIVQPRVANEVAPFKITEEIQDAIAEKLAMGVPLTFILDQMGIDRTKAYEHMRSDAAFKDKLSRARGEFALRNIQRIDAMADEDWRAAGWMLERVLPDHFGKQTNSQVTHSVMFANAPGGPTQYNKALDAELVDNSDVTPSESTDKE